MFRRGEIVECIEDGTNWNDYGLTLGKEYVVNRVEQHHGADYIVVLTDKDEGQPMLHSMFRHAPRYPTNRQKRRRGIRELRAETLKWERHHLGLQRD